MDGNLDPTTTLVASYEGVNLFAIWDGEFLYLATQTAPSQSNDVFIFISDSIRTLWGAP